MNQWMMRLAVAGLILATGAGVVACSDDDSSDEMTLEQYFAAVDEIDNATTARIDAKFAELTDEATVEQYQEAFAEVPAALSDAHDDFTDIDPPAEVEDKHDALAVALGDYAQASQDASDAGADATTVDEFEQAVFSDAYSTADEAFTTACLDLQNFGADNGITVDLGCEDEEEDASSGAEDAMQDLVTAWNAGDVEAFAALFTDEGLVASWGDGETDRATIVAALADVVGEGQLEIRDITSEPTDAGADVTIVWSAGRILEKKRVAFVEVDGAWKVNGDEVLDLDPPKDTTVVSVDLKEFSFGFDASQVTSTSPMAFAAHNVGTQPHHMILAKIPADADVEELLMSEDTPPGVEEIGGGEPFGPGESSTLILANPLEPGRYLMVCFMPDTTDAEETPHAFKGMVSDFTVQ